MARGIEPLNALRQRPPVTRLTNIRIFIRSLRFHPNSRSNLRLRTRSKQNIGAMERMYCVHVVSTNTIHALDAFGGWRMMPASALCSLCPLLRSLRCSALCEFPTVSRRYRTVKIGIPYGIYSIPYGIYSILYDPFEFTVRYA